MKRKQQVKRLLSGLLAVGMCAGMVTPAAYAEEALPVAEPAAEQEGELPDNTVELPAETPAEQPAEEQSTEEKSVEEQPIEEQPAEEQPAEEQPIEEKPVEEQPAEEKTTAEETTALAAEEPQPVAEPAAEQPAGPTLAFGAEKWDPAQPGRFVLNSGSNAVDSVAMTLTGDAAARYDLRADGTIALKDGAKAVKETLHVTAKADYYTPDQLLYSNPLEAESALTPSKAGKVAYTVSSKHPRTGTSAVTTAPVGSADGAYFNDKDLNQTGTIVFWYYDPCTEEETDPEKFVAANPDLDQYKFGVCVNGYSDLFLGAAIPASGDNISGAKDAAARASTYSKTYTYRAAGAWKPTNIARTEGWHKMEINVTAAGATMKIDGQPVCDKGSETPVTVTGVKTIKRAILATNWADKAETKKYVQDKHFIDDLYILKADAGAAKQAELNASVAVEAEEETPAPPQTNKFELVYQDGKNDVLKIGENGRVYLDKAEDYAVASVIYTTDNENVQVDMDGTLHIKPGYQPGENDTVRVTANVEYFDPAGVVFADSFEGDKLFTAASNAYSQSEAGSLFGRKAATLSGTKGYAKMNLAEPQTDVTVTAWYYDTNEVADQIKFGFGINSDNSDSMGIFYDGSIAAFVDDATKTHYGIRTPGISYKNYGFGTTDVERSAGWHKFEWVITSEGTTEKIDGKIVSTNSEVSNSMTPEQKKTSVKLENRAANKQVTALSLLCGWADNGTNLSAVKDRQFIDGVSIVKNGTATHKETIQSGTIKLADAAYTLAPETFTVDSSYPTDKKFSINPYKEGDSDFTAIQIDGKELTAEQWSAGKGTAPTNASNYPKDDYTLTVSAAAFKGLAVGSHTLTAVLANGRTVKAAFTAEAHTPTEYYLSQNGDDSKDGHTAQTAWKSFEKLETVTFGPGDHIYLDATSTWSGVQFQPKGSGAPGAPIVLTKYNDGGDSAKRPILNGDGTRADRTKHSYVAFEAWRKFYPSGTIELFNVENWEVRGIEVTNYEQTLDQGATGRNGIAVIFDYFETQGLTKVPADKEKAFYRAGKLQHIVIDDCYIHDVAGYHPYNGATGAGSKMSGGINVYGPYDDLQINNNIVMYCDVEGIRNDVLAWQGDSRTQFPAYMNDVSISNNYIVGVPGDGVVISSADKPMLQNNYLTDAGYSYLSDNKNQEKPMGNRQNPKLQGSANYAGLWFIGTKDAVAQYNEAVNNVWVCNDAEAFDADMFCWGTVFQYNYTYRNNGGFCLFMPTMDAGTIMRYNVSVEDAQSVGLPVSQNSTLHYSGTPEAIHNNLIVLGDKVYTMFSGSNNKTYFYNNIVIAPNGLRSENGSYRFSESGALNGEVKNNIFYPAAIVESINKGSSLTMQDNIVLNSEQEMKALFADLDGFMNTQPVKALKGRSDFTGSVKVNTVKGTGAGVAMTAAEGRNVKTPTGGFDLSVFAGIRLADGSAAIGKGLPVSQMRSYSYKAQNDAANPLTQDFFCNDIANAAAVDIGPHQYSAEKHEHRHSFGAWTDDKNGETHTRVCTGCEEKQTENHSWNDGETKDNATTYTCTVCGAARVVETQTQLKQEALTTESIPQELKDKGFDTPEKITVELKQKISEKQSAENVVFCDVVLKISTDGGQTWVEVAPGNFPTDGMDVELALPGAVPADKAGDYDYVVAHMLHDGTVELPECTLVNGKLVVHVNSLSPFAISWTAKNTSAGGTTGNTGSTGNTGNNGSTGNANNTTNTGNTANTGSTNTAASTAPGAAQKPAPKPAQVAPIPQTGDDQPIALYAVLAIAAVIGMAGLCIYKKKHDA